MNATLSPLEMWKIRALLDALSREQRAELVRDARKRIEKAEQKRRDAKAARDDKRAERLADAKAQAKRDAKKGKS